MRNEDIGALRLCHQQITHTKPLTTTAIVRHMGAMQAQDYNSVIWSIGLRTDQPKSSVIAVIESKEIIRTWPQRGTLHFIPRSDARWLVNLSADRILKIAARRREQLALDDATLFKSQRILEKALSGNLVSRPEVLRILEEAGISTGSGRGYHILWYLSQTSITYIGPMIGKQQSFGLTDDILPNHTLPKRSNSVIELAKRYFVSHGPATVQDFMWWSGLTAADAKQGLIACESILELIIINKISYWMPKNSNVSKSNRAYLLPGFDEFILGYKDRTAILSIEHASHIVPGNNGVFQPTVLIDGQVVGTWKKVDKKDNITLMLQPFRTLSSTDMALLDAPIQKLGQFFNKAVTLANSR
jgi:hypothetical protein